MRPGEREVKVKLGSKVLWRRMLSPETVSIYRVREFSSLVYTLERGGHHLYLLNLEDFPPGVAVLQTERIA